MTHARESFIVSNIGGQDQDQDEGEGEGEDEGEGEGESEGKGWVEWSALGFGLTQGQGQRHLALCSQHPMLLL